VPADEPEPAGTERVFVVIALIAERRLVLYVPEIEAATSVLAMAEADGAATNLISDLTGLPSETFRCEIRVGRPGEEAGA